MRVSNEVGERVAIVGAGGIGFDVAEFLTHGDHPSTTLDLPAWKAEWGITDPAEARGGLAPSGPRVTPPARQVTLLQRKKGKLGAGLGKTTGWIHRTTLKMKQVQMVSGVNYERIADEGLLVSYGDKREDPTWIACDTVVLCAGQVPLFSLAQELEAAGRKPHRIGGALEARLAILIHKEGKTGGDFKEIDLLHRQLERQARIQRFQGGGTETDLNPNLAKRNAEPKKKAVKNEIDEDQIELLRSQSQAQALSADHRLWPQPHGGGAGNLDRHRVAEPAAWHLHPLRQAEEAELVALDVTDHAAVIAFCAQHAIGLVVVGPEVPLTLGLADALAGAGGLGIFR